VVKCDGTSKNINAVFLENLHWVDLENKSCSSSTVRNQMVLLCCHIIAVLSEIRNYKFQTYCVMDFISLCYQINHISKHNKRGQYEEFHY
jgi:hypothetical protein